MNPSRPGVLVVGSLFVSDQDLDTLTHAAGKRLSKRERGFDHIFAVELVGVSMRNASVTVTDVDHENKRVKLHGSYRAHIQAVIVYNPNYQGPPVPGLSETAWEMEARKLPTFDITRRITEP